MKRIYAIHTSTNTKVINTIESSKSKSACGRTPVANLYKSENSKYKYTPAPEMNVKKNIPQSMIVG